MAVSALWPAAGQTVPVDLMPLFSVIIPVRGGPELLEQCLGSIRASSFRDFELLVSDDGSPDAAAIRGVAQRFGARLVRSETSCGPGAARNAAASLATGAYLVFIDADCTAHPDTLEKLAQALAGDPGLDAIMGSYDFQPEVHGPVGTFRNLMHAWVHHRSSHQASTFWTGCGALRREKFEALGGFQERYRPIEEVELGMRLRKAGGRLALDPSIQVTHHKEWTLRSMLRTDLFDRAVPFTEILFLHGLPWDLNFRWQDRMAAALAGLLPVLAFLALRFGSLRMTAVAAATLASIIALEWSLWRFLTGQRGIAFAALAIPLYLTHQFAALAGLILGLFRREHRQDRAFPLAVAVLAAAIAAVQIHGGAYKNTFDGYPDEAAHFVTGLMIHDALVDWPAHPIQWAEQYYLHYPKVALGHWPPVFPLMEGVWWLFLPPARWSAMLLIGLLGLAGTVVFYRIARKLVRAEAALLLTLVLIASPVFQQSLNQVMAETASLLFGVLFFDVLLRMADRGPRPALLLAAGLWCVLGVLTKGTGICLLPAPALALVFSGHKQIRNLRVWGITLAMLAVVFGYFVWQSGSLGEALGQGGLGFGLRWKINFVPLLAGWGVVALAVGGLAGMAFGPAPAAAASAAMALAFLATSFFLRAMTEPRHWILLLPPLLVLAALPLRILESDRFARARVWALPAAGLLALALFPWSAYHQPAISQEAILKDLKLPSRVLVSSADGWHEGGWIALAALQDQRPASVLLRASKVLAQSAWSGSGYVLLSSSSGTIEDLLDRWRIDAVIVDDRNTSGASFEHHRLLKAALAASPSWQECDRTGNVVSLWRRVRPAAGARQSIAFKTSSGLEIEER